MEIRDLSLLVSDDSEEVPTDTDEAVQLASIGRKPGSMKWLDHCESLGRQKSLSFDLLSLDILFSEDHTDPEVRGGVSALIGAEPRLRNCSGLYHGMMLLVRREALDDYGNRMPLAWELRSFNPELLTEGAIAFDAIRAYGMLRCFMAEPRQGESTSTCLLRERLEQLQREGRRLGIHEAQERLKRARTDDVDLTELFLWEFRNMVEVDSTREAKSFIKRLLPVWRRRFLDAVRQRRVLLNPADLRQQVGEVEARAGLSGAIPAEALSKFYIPVAGWSRLTQYGLSLKSVTADRVLGGEISLDDESRDTGLRGDDSDTLRSWLEALASASEVVRSPEQYLALGLRFQQWSEQRGPDSKTAAPMWKNGDWETRCLLYTFLAVRAVVAPRRYGFAQDKYAAIDLGVGYTERTFRDPFRTIRFGHCTTPQQYKRELLSALAGHGPLFHSMPWLRGVLYRFCREVLKAPESRLTQCAPGLLEPGDLVSA